MLRDRPDQPGLGGRVVGLAGLADLAARPTTTFTMRP